MAAVTVPPPGWVPIGARELLVHARRNFSRALLISGLAHFAILGAALWLYQRARVAEPTFYGKPAILVPRWHPPSVPVPPSGPARSPSVDPRAKSGLPEIAEGVDLEDLFRRGVNGVAPGRGDNPSGPPVEGETGPTGPPPDDGYPDPHQFVFYEHPPVPIVHPEPKYPDWAREAGIEGRVVLHVLVGRDGSVVQVRVIEAVEGGLTEAARDALARWTFKPALSGGRPVAVWVVVPVVFRLP